jgi:chromosomal replication initiation ATPase DnaA
MSTSAQDLMANEVATKLVAALQTMGFDVFLGQEKVTLPNHTSAPLAEIMRLVTERFGFTMADLLGPRRLAHLAIPRHMTYWLARTCTECSLTTIGEAYSRDHTTILYGINRFEKFWAVRDPEMKAIADEIKASLVA